MGAAIAQYRSMPEEALRRECIRLARCVARLEGEKALAEARRDHWFREREAALDEIEQLRPSV
ncbi:hypothetical protein FDY98_25330 (plasmid) [Halomonas sp. PA16-9]|nr:hypothetical protein FDY98_25330 [Halomonas sp. PA16-9]